MTVSPEILARLRRVRAALFDMDGVLYVGDRPLAGVQPLFDYLAATGRRFLCLTNNSTRTPESFAAKLAGMGVTVTPRDILGSAQATAGWLAERAARDGKQQPRAIVMGEEGLRAALIEAGFTLTGEPEAADYAVAAIYFGLDYASLSTMTRAIRRGIPFVGTNSDASLPTERGHVPGTGAVLAFLATASGIQPRIIGKPAPAMFEQAMHRLGVTAADTLMVGDRYETDIEGAVPLGLLTAGVLTGVTSRVGFEQAVPPPHLVVEHLPALLELFQQADASGQAA